MLKLKPSARMDRRYILIKGKKSEIENAILEFIGVLGWAESSPIFVHEVSDEIVLSVERKSLSKVKAAISLSKDKLKILRVSGTLKGLDR